MFKCDNKCSACDKCIIKILELQLENEKLKNKLYEKLLAESSSTKKNTYPKHSSSPLFTSLLSSTEFISSSSILVSNNNSSILNSILNSCSSSGSSNIGNSSIGSNIGSSNNISSSSNTPTPIVLNNTTTVSPQIGSIIPELKLSDDDYIDQVFKSIETSRQYVLKLEEIKEYRKKLLGKIHVFKYIDLIANHNSRLQKIADIKNHDKRKTRDIISKTLTPLESRLIFFDGYTNSQIDIDDLKKFEVSVSLLNNEPNLIPFKHQEFIKHFKTYGMALMDIKDYFEKLICNPHKHFNLIYVSNPKSTLADPYTFYYLDKIDTEKNNKKNWKMICRLEDLTNDIIDSTLVFCIQMAKQIYRDVFCDNSYRRDFSSKSAILSSDFMQLFYNLLLLTHPIKFCKTLQTIVINNCGYVPNTDHDKFNLTADDKVQQKKFNSGSLPREHYHHLVQQIFEDIQTEEIDHFLSKFEF